MGKYIKLFETHSEYEAYIGGEDAFLPNVSYCEDINDVHYNPIVVGINTYISCTDIASGEELAGSHIQVLGPGMVVVEEWTSTTEVHEVEGLNKETTYTLRTTVAPNGYVLATATTFTIDGTGQITYSGNTTTDEDGNTVLLVEIQKTILKVSCVNNADGEELAGSHIQVLDSKENVAEEWDSGTEPHTIEGLNVNEEYTLKTTLASEGFILPTDATFTIDETGHVTSTGSTTTDEEGKRVLLVEMQITILKVACTDIGDGADLEGAHIEVIDSKGTVVEQWDSTTDAHQIEGLKTGETYTLSNTVAPDGYLPASETTFTIDETGHVTSTGSTIIDEEGNTVLLVEVQMTQVQVLCVDIADGAEVEGSHIQVLDQDGRVAEEWDSTTEAHQIEGLKTGETYTLRTTVASEGYVLTTDTTFSIDEHGEVTSTGTISEEGILFVEMEKTKVKVSSVDVADGAELEGNHIQVLDSEGNVVEEWDSTTEAHEIEGLKTGEEYTLRNTVASDGYVLTSDTTFTINDAGRVTSSGTITEDGIMLVELAKTQVQVLCVDVVNGEEVKNVNIQLNDSEEMIEEWASTTEPHMIEGLKTGETYTLRTTIIPEEYLPSTETTFTIDETGRVTSSGGITADGILLVELRHK